MRTLICALLMIVGVCNAQVLNYYVAPPPTGNDSRTATQAQNLSTPWLTICHADQNLTLGTAGTVVHVLAGNYTSRDGGSCGAGEIVTTHNGTATQTITFESDSASGVYTPFAAKITCNGTAGNFGYCWEAQGNYQIIKGFELVGGAFPTAVGLRLTGGSTINPTHNLQAIGNQVHNFGPACSSPSLGLGGVGILNNGVSATHDNDVIGNVVYDIGVTLGYNTCSRMTGIYMSSPGGHAYSNLVYNINFTGILTWHGETFVAIAGNTLWHIGRDGIVIGCGDSGCTSNINNSIVANNIIRNSNNGIRTEGSVGPNNACSNNDLFSNVTNFIFDGGTTPCTQSGNITADPLMVAFNLTPISPVFSGGAVNFPNANYHLTNTSPSLKGGITNATCGSGRPNPCTATSDFDGLIYASPPSIGAYQFAGISGPNPPTGLNATVN